MVRGKKYVFSPKSGYYYVRKRGKYLGRINAEPGTEEFDRIYWSILNKKIEVKTTVSALIDHYRKSNRWQTLKPLTRKSYDVVLKYFEEKNGQKDACKLTRKDIVAARDANSHRPRFAGQFIAVISVLYEHALDIGWVHSNPAKGVRKPKIPKERQRPHEPWTDEACDTFRRHAHRKALLAFELGVGSVQRPGDLIEFTWGDYDGYELDVTQGKTEVRLKLPCIPSLKRVLDEEKEILGGSPHPSLPILTGIRGQKLTYSGLSQMIKKERRRLGLDKYDQHGWRYRGVMELAWAGCTDDEIMSYSGHATKEMVRKYAGEARQRMHAQSAFRKRGGTERE